MDSLDVDALFTKIPLDETIDIYVKNFFRNPKTLVKEISKHFFRDLLNLVTKESFFAFNNKFYIQVDDVTIGFPLYPILANNFLSHHEENWMNKHPIEFKPSFYRRYVDDIFVLFESPDSPQSHLEYMSPKHQNINFTVEYGNIGSLLFLDVKICRKNGKFATSVYRKPIFSGVFTNYESFILTYYKRGLLRTLLHRSFNIFSDFKTFHLEIDHLKTIIKKKKKIALRITLIRVSNHFFINCIRLKVIVQNVPKKNAFVKLPFLGSGSFQIRKRLQKLFTDKLTL